MMGAGGRMFIPPPRKQQDIVQRVPCKKPPFTLGQLKKAIPPHCFNRSILRSFSYVVNDLAIVTLAYLFATSVIPQLPASLRLLAWPMYWVVQGCVLMGIWLLGHECGHHAFSNHTWLDDTVGFVLHASVLVPYFAFKYSHRRHHANTGSLERDEGFVPKPKSQVPWFSKYLNNPPGRFLSLTIMLMLGWPLYLAFNISGRKYDRFACHYDPYGPFYTDRERAHVFISDISVLLALSLLVRLVVARGIAWVACVYGVPLLIMNGFIVVVTYLQHTHVSLPHYDSSEWDWLRGALATVDRDFGILNKVFHNIMDTHVAHHLFSTIPHYHAMEATKAIKPILGEYYRFDGTSFWRAMWRETRECLYVEPDDNGASEYKGVFWYHNNL